MSKLGFNKLQSNMAEAKRQLLFILPNVAIDFWLTAFDKQGWTDSSFTPWKPRKYTSKKNAGRSLLVQSGALRRAVSNSARSKSSSTHVSSIKFVVDLPYAAVHNEGGKFTRKATERSKFVGSKVKHTGIFTGSITTQSTHRIASKSKVGSYVAEYPKRQFMGDSKKLRQLINKKVNQVILANWQR
jgi:phage gpG-like protein